MMLSLVHVLVWHTVTYRKQSVMPRGNPFVSLVHNGVLMAVLCSGNSHGTSFLSIHRTRVSEESAALPMNKDSVLKLVNELERVH